MCVCVCVWPNFKRIKLCTKIRVFVLICPPFSNHNSRFLGNASILFHFICLAYFDNQIVVASWLYDKQSDQNVSQYIPVSYEGMLKNILDVYISIYPSNHWFERYRVFWNIYGQVHSIPFLLLLSYPFLSVSLTHWVQCSLFFPYCWMHKDLSLWWCAFTVVLCTSTCIYHWIENITTLSLYRSHSIWFFVCLLACWLLE